MVAHVRIFPSAFVRLAGVGGGLFGGWAGARPWRRTTSRRPVSMSLAATLTGERATLAAYDISGRWTGVASRHREA